MKRVIDVIMSAATIVVCSPILLLSIIGVALESRGPSFYAGTRRGYLGRLFPCLKLRTMIVNSEQALTTRGLSDRGPEGRLLIYENDPRVTPLGRFFRASSIDELPQLFNVFVGQMSLIGPRPLAPYMLETFERLGRTRSVVRPGISGLWQIRQRMKNASVLDMIDDDMEYVQNFSLALDARIAFATIPRLWQSVRRY